MSRSDDLADSDDGLSHAKFILSPLIHGGGDKLIKKLKDSVSHRPTMTVQLAASRFLVGGSGVPGTQFAQNTFICGGLVRVTEKTP